MQKSEERFDVSLHGKRIGALSRRNDYTWLEFDESYVSDPHRATMGLRFEEDLTARHAANARLPPWFSNLLPEGALRKWIAAARGTTPTREMELLAQVGHDLPGAVQVKLAHEPHGQQTPIRHEFIQQISPVRTEPLWRFSLAGVAMKFSMREKGGQFAAPASGDGGDWIVKLPDASHPHVPLNEFTMMTLASRVGIEVPEVRLVHRDSIASVPDALWPRNEVYAYAVRRFDRAADRQLVHIEDLAQVRGFYPDDKYAGSFETVANLVYRRRDTKALKEFARRLAFYVLVKNGDAHLKNWSLIYRDQRIPTLSPAYDIVSTSVYRPSNQPEDLGLKFCGSRRFATAKLSCFVRLEEKLGTSIDLVEEVRALVSATQNEWPGVEPLLAEQPGMALAIAASIEEGVKQFDGGLRS